MGSQQQHQKEQSNGNCNNKKTRDLPNLSECHSCGFRIDSCDNGISDNNKLHTLYSEWRIVLLCKICFHRVESSRLCSYCFKSLHFDDDDDDCFHCRQCKRIMHKSCFSIYSSVAPLLFASKSNVCIDCWIPKSVLAKRVSFCTKKRSNNNSKHNLLVRDTDCDVQRKVEAATRARELAVEKALAERMASRLTYPASDLVSERDQNDVFHVDDVELTLRLQRVLDSSPMKVNYLCSSSSAGWKSLFVRNGVCRKLDDVSRNGETAANQPSVSVRVSSLNVDSLGSDRTDGSWIRQNVLGSETHLKEGEGSCSDKLMISESQSCRHGDGSMIVTDERCNRKIDRYSIKYTRRTSTDKRSNRKPDLYLRKYARRTSPSERHRKLDRYLRKYSRRKTQADERFKIPDRCSIKYTRRKLNQKPSFDNISSCFYEHLHRGTQALQLV